MLQFSLLGANTRALMLPTRIRRVSIDPNVLLNFVIKDKDMDLVEIGHNKNVGVTLCHGVEIEGLKANLAPRRPVPDKPLLECHQFVPYILSNNHEVIYYFLKFLLI